MNRRLAAVIGVVVVVLVHQVISAAYGAFGAGLHLALLIAGSMLLAGAVIAFVAVRRPRTTVQRPEARSR